MFRREMGFNHDTERRYLEKERYLKSYFSYESKINEIREARSNNEQRLEKERHEEQLRRESDVALRKREHEESEKRMKLESDNAKQVLLDTKYRQYVRENSHELRDLESKLKTAYVNKIREVQLAERKLESSRLKALKYNEARQIERQKEIAKVEDEITRDNELLHKLKYNQSLKRQLEDQEKRNEEAALLQFALDQIMIEKAVQRIYEEDQRLYEEELQKRCQYQEDIQQYLLHRKQMRAIEQERLEIEERKIKQFIASQELKAEQKKEKEAQRRRLCQEMQEKLAVLLQASRKDTTEEEELRYELASEELIEKQLWREKEAFEKRLRDRLQLQRSLDAQLEELADRKRKSATEDEVFRKQMLEKLREEEKLEQLSNQKRRLKELEHRRAVQKLIDEREALRATARQREIEELECLRKAEEQRLRIVDEERDRILTEHARALLGYFPKGTFKNEFELKVLQDRLNQVNVL